MFPRLRTATERPSVRGLYAVTPDEPDTGRLLELVVAALDGGARLIQYRHKGARGQLRLTQALALHAVCQRRGVPLIVNNDVELVLEIEAEGVHLGRDDGDLAQARSRLGKKRLLGVSCYADLQRARRALAQGADYLAFGAAFPSCVKPEAPLASLDLFRQAKRELRAPVVAIGGIDEQNAGLLAEAGVDAVAVISAVFGADDVAAAAAAVARWWA